MTQNHIKLNQLTSGLKNIFIDSCKVIEVTEIKEIDVKGQPTKIATGKIIDDSIKDPIDITAWGFASNFLVKDKNIKIINCYAKEYPVGSGKIQISTGFYGKILEII